MRPTVHKAKIVAERKLVHQEALGARAELS